MSYSSYFTVLLIKSYVSLKCNFQDCLMALIDSVIFHSVTLQCSNFDVILSSRLLYNVHALKHCCHY